VPESWKRKIDAFLSAPGRLSILGVGNPEKGDDAAGPTSADRLKDSLGNTLSRDVQIINTGVVPENFTGDIRRFKTDKTLIIDAVICGQTPGTIFIVDPGSIRDDDISSHRMPLSMLDRFLKESIGCDVLIIGIEPEKVDLDIGMSESVKKSISLLIRHIQKKLLNLHI
jgi:hydrogenase 3 maturation protease